MMFFWLVLLGVWMGWVESVYKRKPEQDIDGQPVEYDWYAPLPEPPEYLRNTYEVTGTGDKADEFVRFVARSRR